MKKMTKMMNRMSIGRIANTAIITVTVIMVPNGAELKIPGLFVREFFI